MGKYRSLLPQLSDRLFLTDGGMETTLVFHEKIDLPHFAAFDLLKDEQGTAVLRDYYKRYTRMANERSIGAVLESPSWRANADWGEKLGYDAGALAEANRKSIALLEDVCAELGVDGQPIVISGNLGPRGDGYVADAIMSAGEARDYHAAQIDTFRQTAADMVSAFTINYVEEAIGIALAAREANLPVVISFTVETDGRLPTGQPLGEAIEQADKESGDVPAYYMINCAHPTHFKGAIQQGTRWRDRIRGLRANASKRSHEELDNSPDLDTGDPAELAREYQELSELLPNLTVLGGCCGTDERHVAAVLDACLGN